MTPQRHATRFFGCHGLSQPRRPPLAGIGAQTAHHKAFAPTNDIDVAAAFAQSFPEDTKVVSMLCSVAARTIRHIGRADRMRRNSAWRRGLRDQAQESAMQDLKLERRLPPVISPSLEQALRASDEILDLLPVAICVCDGDGRIVQYNSRAMEFWGRAPRPRQTFDQFYADATFLDAGGRRLPHSRLAEVLETGHPVRDEEVMIERPNGERSAILVNIDPLVSLDGKPVGAISCFQDITERKRMVEALDRSRQDLRVQEQRWNATYNHAAIGIAEVDANGRFIRVNDAITTMTGWTREDLMGRTLFQNTHPGDKDTDEASYLRQVAGELDFYSVERRFICKDGRTIWCFVRSSTVRDAQGKFLYCVRVVHDITERKAAEERQKLLIDELNHRVKNTLATVQSLATQTAHGTDSPAAFREAFDGRLIALSQVHDQLSRRHWGSAELRDIVIGATAPYDGDSPRRIEIEGDTITIRPRAALTLALALHELTTNAAKYGALSVPEGRVTVRCRIDNTPPKPLLKLEWCEHDGPPVAPPSRQGFGSRFIESSIATELRGTARLTFDPGGLCCTMTVPLASAAAVIEGGAGHSGVAAREHANP
jgi:PAS domain S-box-containing protein